MWCSRWTSDSDQVCHFHFLVEFHAFKGYFQNLSDLKGVCIVAVDHLPVRYHGAEFIFSGSLGSPSSL